MSKKDDGQTVAIVSYLTWIGLIVAIVLNLDKKNDFARYHIRQSLLLMLISTVLAFVSWLPLSWVLWIILFVFWVMGFVYAIQGDKKPVPLIGPLAQDWFKGL